MAESNRKQQEFQTYQKQVEEYKSKYEQVDQYIRENPDWWNHVQQAYQQKAQNLGADPNNIKEIAKTYAEEAIKPIQQKLAEKEQAELFAKQDQELDSQIKSVREKYSDLDFDAVSENGKTLLYEVLEFGATNNITNFDIAFKAFYHDKLINRAETRAKESYTKEIQKRTKLGLLSESSTPKRVVSDLKDVKQKSYNDITKEILDEYGIR